MSGTTSSSTLARPPPAIMPHVLSTIYSPGTSATPHQRLRCILIAIIVFPGMANLTHRPGPYFDSANKICWTTTIDNRSRRTLKDALTLYGFIEFTPDLAGKIANMGVEISTDTKTGPSKIYEIVARITAHDDSGEKVKVHVPGAGVVPLSVPIELEMVPRADTPAGLFENLGWDCIVAILSFETRASYATDGTFNPSQRYFQLLSAKRNPLQTFGYRGWPGEWPKEGVRPAWSVFRKSL